jgi:hypothetical protein
MADILTHALLGAACAPHKPILGAGIALIPDTPTIPMNIYTLIKHKKLAIKDNWNLAPTWMRDLYDFLHGVFIPLSFLFGLWFFGPKLVPFVLAYLSHVVIDAPLHCTTSFLFPLQNANLQLGRDWWVDLRIPAFTISISAMIVLWQQIIM